MKTEKYIKDCATYVHNHFDNDLDCLDIFSRPATYSATVSGDDEQILIDCREFGFLWDDDFCNSCFCEHINGGLFNEGYTIIDWPAFQKYMKEYIKRSIDNQ